MDRIDLPWIDAGATVGEAVGRIIEMKSANGAGAVVSERDGEPVVLPLDKLVEAARADPATPLASVGPLGRGISLPGTMRRHSMEGDFAPIEPMLDQKRADFGVVRLFGSVAHVVTRHETIAETFRSELAVCRCSGPSGHVFFAGELDHAGKCNFDGFPVICS